MVNKVTLIGRVGKDPEFRTTAGGTAMAKFSLATTETRKDKDGQKVEEVSWHRCIVWSQLAEIARDYVHKGDLLCCEGRIQYGSYDKDGTKVYTTDIVVNELKMLGGKGQGERAESAPNQAGQPASNDSFGDGDLPFNPSAPRLCAPVRRWKVRFLRGQFRPTTTRITKQRRCAMKVPADYVPRAGDVLDLDSLQFRIESVSAINVSYRLCKGGYQFPTHKISTVEMCGFARGSNAELTRANEALL